MAVQPQALSFLLDEADLNEHGVILTYRSLRPAASTIAVNTAAGSALYWAEGGITR